MHYYLPYIMLLGVVAAVMGVLAVWASIRISRWLEVFDKPAARKSHRAPVPCLGGLGILLAVLLGLAVFAVLFPGMVFLHWSLIATIVAGAAAIFLVGFTDDILPIRAHVKLTLQIVVAVAMWGFGVRVEVFSLLGEGTSQLGLVLSGLVTVGWYVGLMNSINLVDGLDGLAGGICLIGALSLVGIGVVIGYSPEVLIGTVLATLTAGAVFGFLVWNWHPAKTFMGDGGSLLLGFLLATASIVGSTKTPTLLALAVPMVALGLPLFETTFSFFRRALKGQHPFKPDRRHLHHRLLDMGLDQRRVVLVLLFFTAFLGVNSVLMADAQSQVLLLNVVFMIVGIVILIENMKFLEKQRASKETVPVAAPPPTESAPVSTPEKQHI